MDDRARPGPAGGGALFVVAVLLLFAVPRSWFLALVALLAVWELFLWRLGAPDAEVAVDIP